MADRGNKALHGGGIAQHEVKTHHVPESPVHHQLEDDDIWAVLSVGLHREARQIFVKEYQAPAVAAQNIQ